MMSSPDGQVSFDGAKLELGAGGSATTQTTTRDPVKYTDDVEAERFFSKKEDLEKLEAAIAGILEPEDGKMKGLWILTQIDHWNNEIEKVCALTEKALYIVKYDFVVRKLKYHRTIKLNLIERVDIGNIVYPQKSFLKPRNCGALRIYWGDPAQISMAQKWNPMCESIPYTTFMHHPIFYNTKQSDDTTLAKLYNADEFWAAFRPVVEAEKVSPEIVVLNQDILIECYGGLSSVVFNQSQLGFNKDRNGISF